MKKRAKKNSYRVFGKSLKEYVTATWKFLLIIFIISMIQLLLLLLNLMNLILVDPFAIITMILMVLAGWFVVKKHKFGLKNAAIIGILLFIAGSCFAIYAMVTLLPAMSLVSKLLNLSISIIVNIGIYAAFTVFGAWAAQRF